MKHHSETYIITNIMMKQNKGLRYSISSRKHHSEIYIITNTMMKQNKGLRYSISSRKHHSETYIITNTMMKQNKGLRYSISSRKHHSETYIITNTMKKQNKGLNGDLKSEHKKITNRTTIGPTTDIEVTLVKWRNTRQICRRFNLWYKNLLNYVHNVHGRLNAIRCCCHHENMPIWCWPP